MRCAAANDCECENEETVNVMARDAHGRTVHYSREGPDRDAPASTFRGDAHRRICIAKGWRPPRGPSGRNEYMPLGRGQSLERPI